MDATAQRRGVAGGGFVAGVAEAARTLCHQPVNGDARRNHAGATRNGAGEERGAPAGPHRDARVATPQQDVAARTAVEIAIGHCFGLPGVEHHRRCAGAQGVDAVFQGQVATAGGNLYIARSGNSRGVDVAHRQRTRIGERQAAQPGHRHAPGQHIDTIAGVVQRKAAAAKQAQSVSREGCSLRHRASGEDIDVSQCRRGRCTVARAQSPIDRDRTAIQADVPRYRCTAANGDIGRVIAVAKSQAGDAGVVQSRGVEGRRERLAIRGFDGQRAAGTHRHIAGPGRATGRDDHVGGADANVSVAGD